MEHVYIIGAGLWGCSTAERIANELHLPVTIIEKRAHVGGNCYSSIDEDTGVEVHRYGSHIFHTSNEKVWEYINRFTSFNDYHHRVFSHYNNKIYSMPINLATINAYYGINLSPEEARLFIEREANKEQIISPANLEEKAVSLIGRPLYDAFVKGYTIKQWDKHPNQLPADIITRLPVRSNYNDRYFNDKYEGIPLDGYQRIFENMLASPLIDIKLNTDFHKMRNEINLKNAILCYTGAIDSFFDYKYGHLDWRTVVFEQKHYEYSDHQGTSVINFADTEIPFTRIHEFKHYHPERPDTGKTITFTEYSKAAGPDDEPYYPVNTSRNQQLLEKYQNEAEKIKPKVIFGGRLGLYKYFDMDDAIENALNCFEEQIKPIIQQG